MSADLHTFTVEAYRGDVFGLDGYGRWEQVARWERFGMDEAEALAGAIKAARAEFPADMLRVRPVVAPSDAELGYCEHGVLNAYCTSCPS